MHDPTATRTTAGFSLVEVTLALLVVAVGLTATLGLFPEGLTATREAVNNTETALFADYIFTTLELSAAFECLEVEKVTASIVEKGTSHFISEMFSTSAPDSKFSIHADGKVHTFYWMPKYYGLSNGEMDSDYFDGSMTTAVFTYILDLDRKANDSSQPFVAVLKVWPGEFGDSVRSEDDLGPENARIFYREILQPK